MNNYTTLAIRLELIWWIVTAVLVVVVLYPVVSKIEDYPFLLINILFVIIFITFTRYIFLLKHTFLARRQAMKVLIIMISIPIIAYLINSINYFQTYIDEQGVDAIVGSLSEGQKGTMVQYIRSELLFFGVGSVITAIILPIRLMISIWRFRNRGTI